MDLVWVIASNSKSIPRLAVNGEEKQMARTTALRRLAAAAVLAGIGALPVTAGAQVESNDPIKLTLHDWTGQLITTQIMGEVLKKAGYNIEYVQADYIAQFAGLKTGDLHVAMEMWETTGRDAMDEATATGKVENLGETGMQAIEEWWYPIYMKEKCPGLPELGSLERLCRGVLDTRDRTAWPLSWRSGDLGWLRR